MDEIQCNRPELHILSARIFAMSLDHFSVWSHSVVAYICGLFTPLVELRTFWILGKNKLRKICVSGAVVMIQLTLKSPTYAWVPILSTYWSYKCFNPYFLDQPVRIFVNGGKFSKQYRKIQMFQMEKKIQRNNES